MKMKSQRKAQRDRDKRSAFAATRRTDARNDNEANEDEIDLEVRRSLQGYDE